MAHPDQQEKLNRGKVFLLAVIVLMAILLRFYDLKRMPLHHDESVHGIFALRVAQGEPHIYSPVYHGPLLYYAVGLLFATLGDSDFTARVFPALCGTMLVGVLIIILSRYGFPGVVTGALLTCFSPTLVYFSRFLRNDVPLAFLSLLSLSSLLQYQAGRGRRWLYLWGIAAGLAMTTKENSFIIAFQWVVALWIIWWLVPRGERAWRGIGRKLADDRFHLVGAILLSVTIFCLLFSSFTVNLDGILDGALRWIKYWWGQHRTARIPGPWYYYFLRVSIYEPWIFLFCPFLTVKVLRYKRSPLMLFLLFWACSSLAIYSYLREKVPWLQVHIVVPMVLLFSMGFNETWIRAGLRKKVFLVAFFCPFLFYSLVATINLCFRWPSDPREMLVFTQTSDDVHTAIEEIRRAAKGEFEARGLEVVVQDEVSWPFAWYFRRLPASYPTTIEGLAGPILILDAYDEAATRGPLKAGYHRQRYRLRSWWEPDFTGVSLMRVLRYWIDREPFSPTGSYDFILMLSPELVEAE